MPTTQRRHRRSPSWRFSLGSLRLDARRLDDWPPLVDLGLLEGAERLRGELLARENLLREIDQFLPDGRVGQGRHSRAVELRNDVLRGALRRPQRMPE